MSANAYENEEIDPAPKLERKNSVRTIASIAAGMFAMFSVFAMLLIVDRITDDPGRKASCMNNLRQISLALRNYRDTYKTLPPAYTQNAAGKRLHSWRAMILPYMEQGAVHRRVRWDEPWDAPANQAVRESVIYAWLCPSAADVEPSDTTYLAIVATDGVFSGAEGRLRSEVNDESPTCIMVVEVSEDHAVNWMSPHDINEEEFLKMLKDDKKLAHHGGANVAYADGRVGFLSVDTTAEELRELISIHNKSGKR